jgi:hypothetical protein
MYIQVGFLLFSICSLLAGIWVINRLSPGLDASNEYTKRIDVNDEDE